MTMVAETSEAAAIPTIDVSALYGPDSPRRQDTDRMIYAAASDAGFMTITGLPAEVPHGAAARAELLRIFSLPETAKATLLRRTFNPANSNYYRGFFPLQGGGATYKEGIDIGPDVADPTWTADPRDPLTERTPLPEERALPGWRAAASTYYRAMNRLGGLLMRSLARSLGIDEHTFDGAFGGGISTLRLIHYPERPKDTAAASGDIEVVHKGQRRYLVGAAHVDSGFVTLLAQDGVEGLQALSRTGEWIDVPPEDGTLVVNFGGLLERWTGGRIRATEHRVIGPGRERFSIPFFYEPSVDAVIRPLPGCPAFEPFSYGDHLWTAMSRFVEFKAIADLRRPRGIAA
jgi:isopenicillin N synthase-like dioxygenase